MAIADCTRPALGFYTLLNTLLSTEPVGRLYCSHCASNPIPLPLGATPKTTFTCRACSAALLRARDPQTSTQLAEIGAVIDARVWRESFAGEVPGENLTPR